jgi:O-antigen/teichoic acid export membrane protein
MGVIVKQGLWNSVSLGVGLVLGSIGTLFIFPAVFPDGPDAKDWGVIQLIMSYTTIAAEFLSLGSSRAVVYYHSRIKKDERGGLNSFLWIVPGAFAVLVVVLVALMPGIFDVLVEDPYAATQLKGLILPTALILIATIYFNTAAGYASAYMRTSRQAFLTEVFIRVGVLAFVGLFFIGYISFVQLVMGYALVYGGRMVLQMLDLGNESFKGISLSRLSSPAARNGLRFGSYAMLDSAAALIVNRLDMVMIAAYMGAEYVAYYTIALFMATVIQLPSRALIPISASVLAKAWSNNDMDTINTVYRKTSLTQMAFGGLIFVMIWASVYDLIGLLPPDYRDIAWIFLFLGLAKFVHMAFGINGGILLTSPKYRVSFYLNLVLLAITVITNLWLIPEYGSEGAAAATLISVVAFNLMRYLYLLWKWGMQPFRIEHGVTMAVLGLLFSMAELMTFHTGFGAYADIAVRSMVYGGSGLLLFYLFRVSPEFNTLVKRLAPWLPM